MLQCSIPLLFVHKQQWLIALAINQVIIYTIKLN